MMNIFITGATGFIGKKLIADMINSGNFGKIYCLCHNNSDLPEECIKIIGSLDDLYNSEPIDADICVHLAGITNFSGNAGSVSRVNLGGTNAVIDFAKRSNTGRIIFLSSINVYLSEKFEYAQSKLDAEKAVMNSGLDYDILRSSLVYGNGCPAFDKISEFIKLFHLVPVLGSGKATEQPIYVDELSALIISLILGDKIQNRVIDVYGKTAMTYNEMVKRIADALNRKALLLHLPVKPVLSISKLCRKLRIPFFMEPEQIFHMCENLGNSAPTLPYGALLSDFDVNLRKFLK